MIVGFPVISSLTVDEEIIEARRIWERSAAYEPSGKFHVKFINYRY